MSPEYLALVMFIGVIVMCLDYGPRARMVPLPLAIFGLIMMAAQIVWQNLRSTDELQIDMISVPARGRRRKPSLHRRDGRSLGEAPRVPLRPGLRSLEAVDQCADAVAGE